MTDLVVSPESNFVITPEEFREGQCSHESEYFLECSISCGEMTGDVAEWVNYTNFDIDGLMDDQRFQNLAPAAYCNSIARHLRRLFEYWHINMANDLERAYLGTKAVHTLNYQFKDFHWNTSDRLVAKLLGDPQLRTKMEDKETFKSAILAQTNFADDFKKSFHWSARALSNVGEEALYKFCQDQIVKKHDIDLVAHPWLTIDNYGDHREVIKTRLTKPSEQKARSIIKKSVKLFSKVIGGKPLKIFLNGDTMVLNGKQFDYHIKQQGSLKLNALSPLNGHTPYGLTITDKGSSEPLCSACVYFKDTPVLDQIVALKFYIESGLEEEFLKTANLYNRSEHFDNHPILSARKHSSNILGDAIRRSMENSMVPLGGVSVTHDQFMGEIVPWRNYTIIPIKAAFAELCEIYPEVLDQLLSNDTNYDDVSFTIPALLEAMQR